MPIYEYRCHSCDHLMEVFAKMSDPPPLACDACGGGELEKVLHPVAVHYKGSGFYATDYGSSRKGRKAGDTPATAAEKPAAGSEGGSSSSSSSGDSAGGSSSGSGGSSGSSGASGSD